MNLLIKLSTVTALSLGASFAAAQSDEKRSTFWLLGPFGIEYKLDDSGKSTGTLMLNGVLKKERGNTELKIGPAFEYLIYPQGGARGLGYGARVISAGGIAVGPSIAYVSRPRRGLAFRTAFSFPFGKDYVPFIWEVGLGFQF